jgi:LacI family transcriptional regulator
VLRAVPVGRRWLERQFVAQIGRTPHEEIMLARINTARQLLSKSDLTIDAVAQRCGFSNTNTFYAAFRKSAGEAPGAYRRTVLYGPRHNDG